MRALSPRTRRRDVGTHMEWFNELQTPIQIAVISLIGVISTAIIALANATLTTWLKARADVRIARHNARVQYRKEVVGRYTEELHWIREFVRKLPRFERGDIESMLQDWTQHAWSFDHPEIIAITARDPKFASVLKMSLRISTESGIFCRRSWIFQISASYSTRGLKWPKTSTRYLSDGTAQLKISSTTNTRRNCLKPMLRNGLSR
jgi:hypothetical protein